MKTASLPGLFCSCLLVFLAAANSPVGAASKEFKVGDSEGWRQPFVNESAMYNQWAARNRFHVGDSLRFEYQNDSVLVVDKWGYYHCDESNPISAFNDGNSIVNLDKPGPIYFISGDPNHCKNGQRLVIKVMTLHSISQSPLSMAYSPDQSYLASAPSPLLSSSGVSASASTLVVVSLTLIAAL